MFQSKVNDLPETFNFELTFPYQVPPDLLSLEETTESNPDTRTSQEEEDARL